MKKASIPENGETERAALGEASDRNPGRKVLITSSAFRTMLDEVGPSPVETGGILVGVTEPLIVLAAGAGGENAIREPARFSGDTTADQQCLDLARERFGPGVGIVGAYHKHPSGMQHFSATDLHQAREWVRHFGDGKPMLVGIFAEGCPRPEPRLFLYVIADDAGMLTPTNYRIVKDSDERIQIALARAPVQPEVRETDYWSDEEFRFYTSVVGRQRIQRELTALRLHGWQVNVERKRGESSLRLNLARSGCDLRIVLPPEYPLNPPRAFLRDQRELVGLPELEGWNSEFSIVELAARTFEIAGCARCTVRHTKPLLILEPFDEQPMEDHACGGR